MTGRRALVLGGGGVTGIAWMTGLLAGLAEAGTNLAAADVVIGTSAGSVVGTRSVASWARRATVRLVSRMSAPDFTLAASSS